MRKSRVSLSSGTGIWPCLLLLASVCWFAKPLFAADIQHNALAVHLLRPGVAAYGDLDGDHIPDLASGIRTFRTPQGYSYRVDLDFSRDSEPPKPFSVLSPDSTGLNIEAIDIDGDHDLDLLVSGRLSPEPLGIWFNDGRGRFTRGDVTQYTLKPWQTRPAVHSPNNHVTVVLNFQRRSQSALPGERLHFRNFQSWWAEHHFLSRNLGRNSTGSARLRAPPNLI